ncbi:MAG: peptidoglycan-binding protein [Firmicutes bacterium]|nr:peptidoglycan-binding protein [Bacillota bacterium]
MQTVLQLGSNNHWVATLQADLNLLGYQSGSVTGVFNAQTFYALQAFQRAHGFEQTGITSAPVWQDILAGFQLMPAYHGSQSDFSDLPAETVQLAQQHPAMLQVLGQGSTGHYVATLQADLAELGYTQVGSADGIFGPKTLAALQAFQKAHGFTPNGITSPPVWQDILAGFQLTPAYNGPMQFTQPIPVVPANAFPVLSDTLSLGSTGHVVATLQADLRLDGETQNNPVSGVFSAQTEAAVKAFQTANNLPATGIVNTKTWEAILQPFGILPPSADIISNAPSMPQTTSAPAPAPATHANAGAAAPAQNSSEAGAQTIDGLPIVAQYHMIATAYGPSLKANYPYGPVDAFGQPLEPGMIAVDPSVIPLKSTVYVSGYTDSILPSGGFVGHAMDTGGAIKGYRIDIFLNADPAVVSEFGVEPVTVDVLGQ